LAHFLEHLAFKGTDKIGIHDTSEFMSIFMRNGGYDVNAATSKDQTTYTVSLPADKLELWAYLESERFQHRVIREFEKELGVVSEERRMTVDNQAEGKLYEAFVKTAFDNNPYKSVVIGSLKDIQGFTPGMVDAFYQKYIIPSRTVLCLVGNFNLAEAEKVIRNYFGAIPVKPEPDDSFAGEMYDVSTFPRSVTIRGPEKTRFLLGYHRPAVKHPDDIVFDVISELLCGNQTARLIKKFVVDEKKAASIDCWTAAPGARLDTVYAFRVMPLTGVTHHELEELIKAELARLALEGPSVEELQKVVNTVEANFVYSLESNADLASQLAYFQTILNRWEYVGDYTKLVRSVSAKDVKRVVAQYFVPQGEVTAYYEN
jgi:predicted Zn-dependent peptidase